MHDEKTAKRYRGKESSEATRRKRIKRKWNRTHATSQKGNFFWFAVETAFFNAFSACVWRAGATGPVGSLKLTFSAPTVAGVLPDATVVFPPKRPLRNERPKRPPISLPRLSMPPRTEEPADSSPDSTLPTTPEVSGRVMPSLAAQPAQDGGRSTTSLAAAMRQPASETGSAMVPVRQW
jgi:hypothetical protein